MPLPRRPLVWIVTGMLLVAFASIRVDAQDPRNPSFEYPFRSNIKPWMIEMIAERLGLSEEQEAALLRVRDAHEDRFAAFVAEHADLKKELDDAVEAERVARPARFEKELEREKTLAPVADAQHALDEQFFQEVGQIPLTEEQRAEWPGVMRDIHRRMWGPRLLVRRRIA